jgi:hypothetical protein
MLTPSRTSMGVWLAAMSSLPSGVMAKVRSSNPWLSAFWIRVGSPLIGSIFHTTMLFSPPLEIFRPLYSTVPEPRFV